MSKKQEKTNVMRKLDSMKIPYKEYINPNATGEMTGVEMANAMGQNPKQVFKTLVTTAKSGQHYVFVIPVECELDLKKAAVSVKEKAITMLKAKELLGLTGYVHGGCSPVGMKKFFPTVIHETASDFETILFSGGRIGYQVEVSLENLKKVIPFALADVVV
jgi:Cys-tRNA(Pro)/Cys-tRNA(Cys) deacylase